MCVCVWMRVRALAEKMENENVMRVDKEECASNEKALELVGCEVVFTPPSPVPFIYLYAPLIN